MNGTADLSERTAIVTGASNGIGRATAILLAEHGATVLAADFQHLEENTDRFEKLGIVEVSCDVRQEVELANTIKDAVQQTGRLDILVNNAGVLDMAGVEATTRESWDRIIATNQTGVWLGMKAAAEAMRRAGGGSIINTSSIYGLIGSGGATAYQATKGAVRLLTKTAAIEFAGAGIRVNSVHPGIVDTPMVSDDVPAEVIPIIVGATPLQRMARPDEISYGVLFLASDEASYVTGSELVIDGGYSTQ